MTLAHTSLEVYYRTIFALIQHHKWSLTDIESMAPFERDLYVDLLIQHLESENEKNA